VPDFERVTRDHVLQVLDEYDAIGSIEFLGRFGFGRARDHVLRHDGKEYDSKAVLGVAHLRATGVLATSHDLPGGREGASAFLRRLGFAVDAGAPTSAGAAPRTATSGRAAAVRKAAASRRPVREERPVAVCPTCFQQLPATGACDNCS
jgi:hypothetical protein